VGWVLGGEHRRSVRSVIGESTRSELYQSHWLGKIQRSSLSLSLSHSLYSSSYRITHIAQPEWPSHWHFLLERRSRPVPYLHAEHKGEAVNT
jgi:hypothetical protein